ncbi:MAG: DNA polymerase III subunit delta [Salibacteraceae bacterium]
MANLAEYSKIVSDIKAGSFYPIYLLHGEEPYYIDKVSQYIEQHALAEHERDFNQHVYYGRDLDKDVLRETLRRFPVMAEKQLIIVREAQDFKGRWADFADYFKAPNETAILVLDFKYKKADGKSAWVKAIKNTGVIMESKKVYENEMPALIQHLVKSRKYRIHPEAVQLMVDHLGMNIEKVELEIEKLTIRVPLSQEISVEDVRKNIGFSREFNQYEYLDALCEKNAPKSYKIAQVLGKNEKNNPMVLILNSLYDHFSKVMVYHGLKDKSERNAMQSLGLWKPFQLQKISRTARYYDQRKLAQTISLLREFDARFKGVGIGTPISNESFLKELTFKILN